MNIVILGTNYQPEVAACAPFTTGLAEHLASRGHRVTVLTTFPHYPEWKWHVPPRGFRKVEAQGGVEIRRFRIYVPSKPSTLSRILYDSIFGAAMLPNAVGVGRADWVICVSPPLQAGLTAAVLARIWNASFVMLIKDLPLEAGLAVGLLRKGVAYRAGQRLERMIYRRADRFVVISPRMAANVLSHGIREDRILEIPDWASLESQPASQPDNQIRSLLGASYGDFLTVYSGNIGQKQGLATVVAAASRLQDDTSARFALLGDGSDRPAIERLTRERGLGNLRLLPLQPPDVYGRVLASADALLLPQRLSVIDSVAPSKLLNYMAAGRPVLASVHPESAAATLIGSAGCGVVVPAEDHDALADGVRALMRLDSAARRRLGESGRAYVEENFSRSGVLSKWDRLLEQAAPPAGR